MSKKHSMLPMSFPTEWPHLIFIHHGGPPTWITQSKAAYEFVELGYSVYGGGRSAYATHHQKVEFEGELLGPEK